MVDRSDFALEGAGVEVRYRLINREKGPFGLTLAFEPGWGRVDETRGGHVRAFSAGFEALLDKELVPHMLFGALNFAYEPEWSHDNATSESERSSQLASAFDAVSALGALAACFAKSMFDAESCCASVST